MKTKTYSPALIARIANRVTEEIVRRRDIIAYSQPGTPIIITVDVDKKDPEIDVVITITV